MKKLIATLGVSLLVSGCSTISGWFADEEELEIRQLQPIDATFTPSVQWQQDIGRGVDGFFSNLHPAVAYGKVFAASRDGVVMALDKTSGKRIWRIELPQDRDSGWFDWFHGTYPTAKVAGGLVASYDKVFVGTEDGMVVALAEDSGAQVWKTDVAGEVLSTPAVDGGLVVVNTGAGDTVALDAETGEEKWRYESEVPPLSLRGLSSPVMVAGGVLTGTATGKVAVAVADNGMLAWEQAVAAPTGATELERLADIDVKPLVAGNMVYVVSYDGTLAALELRSGRVLWKREYASYQTLSIAGNNLFAVDLNGVVYALDRRNGIELWSVSSLKQRGLTAAVTLDDYLLVGDKWGFVHWLNQEDGKVVARLSLGGDDEDHGIYTAPVVDGKVFYTQTRSGTLYAVETP